MRSWPSQGPPGSFKNTIVFVMKIKIVYFLVKKSKHSKVIHWPRASRNLGLFALLPQGARAERPRSAGQPGPRWTIPPSGTLESLRSSPPWPPKPWAAPRPPGRLRGHTQGMCPPITVRRQGDPRVASRRGATAGLETGPGGGRGRHVHFRM